MKRRDFVHRSLHATAGSALFGPFADQLLGYRQKPALNLNNDHVLVVVFLNGGNDSLNTVVPLSQMSTLNSLRPHVVLPENKLLKIPSTDLALHPSLPGFQNLLQEGKLSIIRGVGYPNQNYSHFRSSDIWMSGSDADQLLSTGWAGRYLNLDYPNYPIAYPTEAMPDPLSIELGYSNSLLFQGPLANMSVVINGERDFYQLVEDEDDEIPDTHYGDKLAHVKLVRRQTQVYGTAVRDAAQKVTSQFEGYPNTSIAQQLKICARLIAGGMRTPIYKVELGGFDTHAAQVDPNDHTQGTHANLLRELDDAISAFMADLAFLGLEDRVTGMTFSEFGRRIVSNSSNGTDHGSAGPMFVFGKHVNGGIIGTDYELDPAMTFEDNLVFQHDFRQVYGSMLSQWLCIGSDGVSNSLLGAYETLPIISDTACQSTATFEKEASLIPTLKVIPNPVHSDAIIELDSAGELFELELIDLRGRRIRQLFRGKLPNGRQKINTSMDDLAPGNYFIRLTTKGKSRSTVFIKAR